MKWIIIIASCTNVCSGYGLDWSWQQDIHKIYYETKVECDAAREYENEMFQKSNPTRKIEKSFCMPLDRWLSELPVVGNPLTEENERMKEE